jgi:hypothetical protein
MVSAIADLRRATGSELEAEILDARAIPGGARRHRRTVLLAEVRRRARSSSATAEDWFLLGRALWTLYRRLDAARSLEALRALDQCEGDPGLQQMARLLKLYLLERASEYRGALLVADGLDLAWFEAHDLEWRWLTALEYRVSALVRLGLDEAVPVFEEAMHWLDRQDQIGAAPPKVLFDAVAWGTRHARFPSEVSGENPLAAIARRLAGSGMEWVTEGRES